MCFLFSVFLYDSDTKFHFFQDGLEVHQKHVILISMNTVFCVLERAMTTPRQAEPT